MQQMRIAALRCHATSKALAFPLEDIILLIFLLKKHFYRHDECAVIIKYLGDFYYLMARPQQTKSLATPAEVSWCPIS
jgi:hypothetical protein